MKILVLDDEKDICLMLQKILEEKKYQVVTASSEKEAYLLFEKENPDIILLDIWLKGEKKAGLKVLSDWTEKDPLIPILMISGHGTVETAVEAMKQGAFDFIEKPFKTGELLVKIDRAAEVSKLRQENRIFAEVQQKGNDIVGKSPYAVSLRETIRKVSRHEARILITGGSGTGKKHVASVIAKLSKRANKPILFVQTGDDLQKNFKKSRNGTLIINEIFDLTKAEQEMLVKCIRDKADEPRIISLTTRMPEEEIAKGNFRQDLYYRLNIIRINLSPLREHIADLDDLARFFLKRTEMALFTREAERALKTYAWPGNIRQLKNVMEGLLIMKVPFPVKEEDLPIEVLDKPTRVIKNNSTDIYQLPLKEARRLFEAEYLNAQWNMVGGNISKMAEKIEMERTALHRKLKDLGIK